MLDLYFIAKWMHILSSTVLFGTGIGTAFQMVCAMRHNRPEVIYPVSKAVVWADWLFTTPAGLLQPLTGIWLVYIQGYSLFEPWLIASYALYLFAFICWAPVVHLQIRIRDLAKEALSKGTSLPAEAKAAYRFWFALGWPAFISLMLIFWLMITKPTLW